jgi:hypothetical protein
VGCSDAEMKTISYKIEVEVAPDKWLSLDKEARIPLEDYEAMHGRRKDPHNLSTKDAIEQIAKSGSSNSAINKEESSLSFKWAGKTVKWKGNNIVPVALREHKGKLYLIGFNRQNMEKCRFNFYELNEEGNAFKMINAGDYPREIATQNMWLSAKTRFVRVNDILVDEWQMLRALDIKSPAFDSSMTAKIWFQIETGKEYYEISYVDLNEKFINEYVEKYKPIALPTIVKERNDAKSRE